MHHVSCPSLGHSVTPSETLSSTAPDLSQSPSGPLSSTYGTDIFDLNFPAEQQTTQPSTDDTLSQPPLLETAPRITHPREAYLLKYFTQTWGPIFDCLDADLTFTKSAMHIALTSFQPLFWAILATSALQLSRVSNYPMSAAKYYRSQCSKSIMPILLRSAQPGASEEPLFATYVMLRNYDHMTGNYSCHPSLHLRR